jgi:thiamine-monophosphate kinase
MKGEFEFIHYIKKSFGLRAIGDDCAVLPKDESNDLVITADLLVEDVDFRLDWTKPEDLGYKSLSVSLSDIAAMGGQPAWAMLTLGIPEKIWETDFVKRFYDGWIELAAEFRVELIGGDISRSPDRFVIDSIACGQLSKDEAVLRSGAKPGDKICVSGSLGGAAGGLRLLENKSKNDLSESWQQRLVERQLRPFPRVTLGRFLREKGLASSMIDISDGISSDIHHLCEASGVGASIDAALLPVDKDLKHLVDADQMIALALNGGEDFELLFTVPKEKISTLQNADVTQIGIVTETADVVRLTDGDKTVELQPSGYRHF